MIPLGLICFFFLFFFSADVRRPDFLMKAKLWRDAADFTTISTESEREKRTELLRNESLPVVPGGLLVTSHKALPRTRVCVCKKEIVWIFYFILFLVCAPNSRSNVSKTNTFSWLPLRRYPRLTSPVYFSLLISGHYSHCAAQAAHEKYLFAT